MKVHNRFFAMLVSVVMTLSLLSSCLDGFSVQQGGKPNNITSIEITGSESRNMTVGDVCLLEIEQVEIDVEDIIWTVDGDAVSVDKYGIVVAKKAGVATVMATYENFSDSVEFTVTDGSGDSDASDDDDEIISDPYVNISKTDFYENYTPAKNFIDAYYRTQHGLLSGTLEIPSQAPTPAADRPMQDGLYVRNTNMRYEDNGNTYVVFDSEGNVAFKVYRGAAYITLEEVAAYMFAFGGADGAFPANYSSNKKPNPSTSPFGEYLRGNHSYFIGDTDRYPREPELPNITGCGGKLQYWEMDIGTGSYNNGDKISRGACRIVYGRNDLDGDGVYEKGELHLFYTYNHYDDFQEYLNYEGGWGEMFGYETNGSSAVKGPSPYVEVVYSSLNSRDLHATEIYYYVPKKQKLFAA